MGESKVNRQAFFRPNCRPGVSAEIPSTYRYGGQFLAFQNFKEGTTTGGDAGDAAEDLVLLDGGEGVAGAGNGEGIARGAGFGELLGTLTERVDLEHAQRAIPENCGHPQNKTFGRL